MHGRVCVAAGAFRKAARGEVVILGDLGDAGGVTARAW